MLAASENAKLIKNRKSLEITGDTKRLPEETFQSNSNSFKSNLKKSNFGLFN